ncbi:DNA-directed RNA polymerase I subunit RPA1 isoform X1 [Hydra vulgaris]|uniref:DNA-directed RNA polymerase I subunit RPA1 isoform X1 n=1 Tax=Hydra vulgaris TaxID=6087 RepID=UPI001F5E3A22|nr:DNA-directed RNA polymerase I subunit RPA1 isoform X1 [Hydra vulgaris]
MLYQRIYSVYFTAHNAEEIRKLAIKKIDNPETFDLLRHPNKGGLYDLALGPNEKDDICDTCSLGHIKCPGHFGYIELPLPVYHPMFFKLMISILRGSCFNCHRLVQKSCQLKLFIRQCNLLEKGFLSEAAALNELYDYYTAEARANISSDSNVQMMVCSKIESYYESVVNNSPSEQRSSTKNLLQYRQDLLKKFIKSVLLKKVKECPHCTMIKRDIRSEYNIRLYFSSASQKSIQKAIHDLKNLKPEIKPSKIEDNFPDEEDEEEQNNDDFDEDDYCPKLQNRKKNKSGNSSIVKENFKENEDRYNEYKKLGLEEYITPEEVKKHLIELWNTEYSVLNALFGSFNSPSCQSRQTSPEMFFLDVIAVPPSKFRPMSYRDEKKFENPETENMCKILWNCKFIHELLNRLKLPTDDKPYVPVAFVSTSVSQSKRKVIPGSSHKEQLQNAWEELQSSVNTLMDNTLNKLDNKNIPGIRQLLEKKEGLFRKNMMGKRVNFACRSVISPDPFINMDEVGIPLVFAKKLTYVQPVTTWNLSKLKQMVINGPNKWPGATMVEYEDGRKTILSDDEYERRAVAKQLLSSSHENNLKIGRTKNYQSKKVYRHLIDGDVLLLNRQPTLHRPSIMAHKAKVLTNERTLRMHYANCKSYNADFDGDEMNAHFPQNELGRSEAYNLVSTHYNYLSPKDGKPLAGLIQDHIVSGVWMTSRDKFFKRDEYQQLIFNALIDSPNKIKTLPPCIIKPVPLWSGKQIFSSVLLNIIPDGLIPLNMTGNKAKLTDSNWAKDNKVLGCSDKDPFLTEGQVIIRGGELMTGILDKTQYGSTQFGLVHCVYELYGGKISGLLLSVLARLFTAYLQHTGFSLGIEDILVFPKSDAKRKEIIDEGKRCGDESAMEALNVKERDQLEECLQKAHFTNKGVELAQLDLSMKTRTDKITNKINSECINGLLKKFPENALQLMVQSGAKGSAVNCTQISCLLGQIELEGRRPPLTISGRSLPSFQPYDTSPRAGGFVNGRFLTGIRPQEYFFHCMAGREGLVDTAVKTSRSGYLQRCLIKHLEALRVEYDMTVRDGDGSVIQFLYGDDGIDVLQNQFLKKEQYTTIIQNYKAYEMLLKPLEMQKHVDLTKAMKIQKKCYRWKKHNGIPFSSLCSHLRTSPFNYFESEKKRKFKKKYSSSNINKFGRSEVELKLLEKWYKIEDQNRYLSKCRPCPDTVLSLCNPSCYFGSVSEKFRDELDEYIRLNPDSILSDNNEENERKISPETFRPFMYAKYLRSVVHPGEAVGLLASQSIGEPSTQMTLNTFHFAGQSDMNVTLGIPRLREILMTASENIQTPQMDILVCTGKDDEAKKICKHLNKVNLIQVIKHLSVFECLTRKYDDNTLCRQFRIRIEFLPENIYVDNYDVNPVSIIKYVETVFIKKLCIHILKVMKDKEKQKLIESHTTRLPSAPANNDEDSRNPPDEPDDAADLSDDEFGDGDAAATKEMNRKKQFSSYDDPEEREEELEETSEIFSANIKQEPFEDYEEENAEELNVDSDQKPKKGINEIHMDPRVANVLKRDRHITGYLVDTQNQWFEVTLQFPLAGSKLMMTSIIEKLAEKSIVHEAPGISRSMLKESKKQGETGRLRIKTEGVNIQELWKYPNVLNLNTIYSNDIHAIAKAYGIEAARSVLIKEVQDVFQVYGIQIDPRHLSMIGDYMTFEGVYKSFNRNAIQPNPFPFQKMSFETSINFLRSATAFGELDDLGSPSSRIVVGRVIGTGTGMVDLLPKLTV